MRVTFKPLTGSDLDSELSDDIEFLGETHMGKEVVVISDEDEDNTNPNSARPVSAPGDAFRLLDLPAELRVYIYQFVLPHNLTISFERDGTDRNGAPQWLVYAAPKFGESYYSQHLIGRGHNRWPRSPRHPPVQTQLFLVNKFVSGEAQGESYTSLKRPKLMFQRSCTAQIPTSLL